jgi:hypothetical protein
MEIAGKMFWRSLNPAQHSYSTLKLDPGEVLEGEVLKSPGNGMIVVRLKGVSVHVESMFDLMPGDRIMVSVAKLEPKVVFNLLYRKNIRSGAIEANA